MLKGLLSPSSISNRQAFPSPTSKNKSNPNLTDSHSTLCASHLKASTQLQDSKFCSFKKIREMKMRQNSERGKVVKQLVIHKEEEEPPSKRMKTLDDAKTIVSHNSERSSIHHSKCVVEESIIIMRGGDQEAIQCFQE